MNNTRYFCIGITPWKREIFTYFLKPEGEIKYIPLRDYNTAIERCVNEGGKIVCWASSKPKNIELECRNKNVELILVEDGFIRSSGLGIKLNMPASLCFSNLGIHYDATQPSQLENMLNHYKVPDSELERVENLITKIKTQKISKYGNSSNGVFLGQNAKNGQNKVLVIGQVEDDASIKLGTHSVKTNLDLIREARVMRPDSFISYKPHPDVESKLRLGKVQPNKALEFCDEILTNVATFDAIEQCDEIHVMTSQTGFEGLLLGKHIVCHGFPFYSGWGLTEDTKENPNRFNKLTLNDLVSAVLIDYPVYINPKTGEFSTPEEVIDLISDKSYKWPQAPNWMQKMVKIKRIYRKIKSYIK